MEKERKNKKIILIILLILILLLSVGFAVFTVKLKIQSTASVSPDPNSFKVVFSSSLTSSLKGQPVYAGKAEGGAFEKDATTISGLNANFTAPGQTATWKFYAYNDGEYDAFLNKVTLGEISCVPDGADPAKVAEAQKGLNIIISVGGEMYVKTNDNINSHKLPKGTGEEIVVILQYLAGSAVTDGDFNVTIGDITLDYNSAD